MNKHNNGLTTKIKMWPEKIQCSIGLTLALMVIFSSFNHDAFASDKDKDNDFIMDTEDVGRIDKDYVTSDQFLELGTPSANAFRLEGENSMRTGDLDRALLVLQRSVEMAPMDMDARISYAEALEKKLHKQKENKKNPKLFNFIVKQWLFISRKSEFPDQKYNALTHISDLTGTLPKRFENDKKFLSRVLEPEPKETAHKTHKEIAENKSTKPTNDE